jgi:IrrE N-terminal-like domain
LTAQRRYPPPEWLSDSAMQEEVDAFLAEFWPEHTWPIDIEAIVDSRAELDIVTAQGIWSAYEIDGFLSNDMRTIYVDEYLARGPKLHRYRFTLAHEIGHWYLHEELYTAAKYSDPSELLRFRAELPASDLASYEWQASQFAGLILVPPHALQATLEQATTFARGKGLDPVDLSNDAHREYIAEWIGRRLEVSRDVVRRRGANDGLWER